MRVALSCAPAMSEMYCDLIYSYFISVYKYIPFCHVALCKLLNLSTNYFLSSFFNRHLEYSFRGTPANNFFAWDTTKKRLGTSGIQY